MLTDYTKRAETDLFSHFDFIYQQSPDNVIMVLNAIEEFALTLKDLPYKFPK